jgi:hypothetical protein
MQSGGAAVIYKTPMIETAELAAWAEQRWHREDDEAARKAALVLARLRAEAWSRVPEWSPELREQFHSEHPRQLHH